MAATAPTSGMQELRAARRRAGGLLWSVLLFSLFVNALMLTGPVFMLQVYDRVLSSRSEATLAALLGLVAFLYLMMGVLDHARTRITSRIGARFQEDLDGRVFSAALRRQTRRPGDPVAQTAQRDLESIQRLLAAPVFLALFDLPWTVLFIAAIFLFHPLLGLVATVGGAILVVATIANQRATAAPGMRMQGASLAADRLADQLRDEADAVHSLGMRRGGFARWQTRRRMALREGLSHSDLGGGFLVFSRTFRLFLQSAILGVGAWLVLQSQLTPGAMIAASILLGRALAPIDSAIGQWAMVQRASDGWRRLAALLSAVPADPVRTELPRPRAVLDVQQITVVPPGEHQASLRMVSFRLEPGQAMGVIGPSGAGKSTLAHALTGLWRPAGGKIRLDGATLDQYDPDRLGALIGYLPQRVALFDATIAENIARLSQNPDPEAVVAAARRAGAHEMILQLPDGYDTRVGAGGGRLSGGQVQRVGLARALYGDPVLLILDEPNSSLDNDGSEALNAAVRAAKAEGQAVLIMAHRPAAIQECDLLMMLDNGLRTAIGPRDKVLREVMQNYADLRPGPAKGGVA